MSGDQPGNRQDDFPSFPASKTPSSQKMEEQKLTRSTHSFGETNIQPPPTPGQTSTSAVYSSQVFETPKQPQGSLSESTGWTPHFAEEYSVFNSTPGNLRGTQGLVFDYSPAITTTRTKRGLSAGSLAAEIATHVNHFSTTSNLPLLPVDPAHRLPSSPTKVTGPEGYPFNPEDLSASRVPNQLKSTKKLRRGTITETEPTQTVTPPPTGRRGERKLAPSLIMNDQSFLQPDFTGNSQQNELAALMAASGDMFTYPLSAPVTAPGNFWDAPIPMDMDMDMDFGASSNIFQNGSVSSHRHTTSYDWNSNEIPIGMFQEPSAPMRPANQESMMPMHNEQIFTQKETTSDAATTAAPLAMSNAFSAPMEDPFGFSSSNGAVNPGLLFSRPQAPALDLSFTQLPNSGSAEAAIAERGSRTLLGGELRRTASYMDMTSKQLDRAAASSPVKTMKPGLNRSLSESRGKRTQAPRTLPKLAPAIRPVSQSSNGSGPTAEPTRPASRPSGRASPPKNQQRLTSLASIPEGPSQPRTSVRFTIDSRGRARAETTVLPSEFGSDMRMRRPSHDRSHRSDMGSEDDDSSDDEPIIIPSRNNSFNASFALPDPRKPVGSIFSSKRSIGDRNGHSFAGSDAGLHNDNGADIEQNDSQDKIGDAASELRKLVEDRGRQKRTNQLGNTRSQKFLHANGGGFRGGAVSPSTLTGSSPGAEKHELRCVCHRDTDEGDGFMVQCESCEMWLHGQCINMNQRTMPRVYVCPFCCATAPNARGRTRDSGRGNLASVASGTSPMKTKSFKSFR